MKAKCIETVSRFTFDNKPSTTPYFERGDVVDIDRYDGRNKIFYFEGKEDSSHEMCECFFFEHFQIVNKWESINE